MPDEFPIKSLPRSTKELGCYTRYCVSESIGMDRGKPCSLVWEPGYGCGEWKPEDGFIGKLYKEGRGMYINIKVSDSVRFENIRKRVLSGLKEHFV